MNFVNEINFEQIMRIENNPYKHYNDIAPLLASGRIVDEITTRAYVAYLVDVLVEGRQIRVGYYANGVVTGFEVIEQGVNTISEWASRRDILLRH